MTNDNIDISWVFSSNETVLPTQLSMPGEIEIGTNAGKTIRYSAFRRESNETKYIAYNTYIWHISKHMPSALQDKNKKKESWHQQLQNEKVEINKYK